MPDAIRTSPTRAAWTAAADDMLAAVGAFRSPSGAAIVLPGRASWSGAASDGFEGFARTFLLAAFRAARDEGGHDILAPWLDGMAAGTGRGSLDAWPKIVDRGQALVEAASVVLGLHITRGQSWDALDTSAQSHLLDWLEPSERVATPPNNWVMFSAMCQAFRASVGAGYSRSVIEDAFRRVDGWYVGDGWHSDGSNIAFDWYAGWAFHLYPWWIGDMLRGVDSAWAADIQGTARERLRPYARAASKLFGDEPLFQGRSLIYRCAALLPLWMDQIIDAGGCAPAVTAGIAQRTLLSMRDRAFDDRGILTLGWHHAFAPMVQPYSGPASPYWASKGFAGLLLGEDAAVWQAEPADPPSFTDRIEERWPAPGFLVSLAGDGISRVVNHGSDAVNLDGGDEPHYTRLLYSNVTSPSYEPEPLDATVSLIGPAGRSRRASLHRFDTPGPGLASAPRHVWPDGAAVPFEIDVSSVTQTGMVVQVVRVTPDHPDVADQAVALDIGGWAVAGETLDERIAPADGCVAAEVTAGDLTSRLYADASSGELRVEIRDGTSPRGRACAYPVLRTLCAEGALVAVAIWLGSAAHPQVTAIDCSEASGATVTLDDGTTIRCPAPPRADAPAERDASSPNPSSPNPSSPNPSSPDPSSPDPSSPDPS